MGMERLCDDLATMMDQIFPAQELYLLTLVIPGRFPFSDLFIYTCL